MMMFLGWSQYNLDLDNEKMEEVKRQIRVKNRLKQKSKKKKKKSLLDNI